MHWWVLCTVSTQYPNWSEIREFVQCNQHSISLLQLDLNNLNVTFSCYCFLLVPSRAPSYISLTDVESTRIKVTWNPVPRQYHNGRLLGYKVYFRETAYYSNPSESSSSSITVSNPNATYVTLTGLLPGQRYDVSVAAFTSKGVGPRSYRYYVTTGRWR